MKKVLLVVFSVLLVTLTVLPHLAFADVTTADSPTVTEENAEIKAFVKDLCELNASGDKAETVNWLVAKFREALNNSALDSSVAIDQFTNKGDNKNYFNIVARLVKAGAKKQIIVGAHYDVLIGEGASDNVAGVAALYYTMMTLADNANKIPFNVTFVAFDGEEKGLLGSNYFVNGYEDNPNDGMSAEEIANTLVMFNIDSIALGDDVYLMCENKHTDLANAILANSDGIVEKPYARGTYGSVLDSVYGHGYGYYEYVQGSDHTPFRLKGIPVAFLFSGTYSASPWGFSESSSFSQVMNSADDTYENLVKSGVAYAVRIQNVGDAIANTIISDGFSDVAENARSQLVNLNFWYNKWWASLVILGILVILVIFTLLYNRKLQKKSILGTAEVKKQKVFDKPDASEIFSFDDSQKSDADDIFTFKK